MASEPVRMKTLAIAAVVLLATQANQISPFEGDWRAGIPAWIKNSSGGGVPSGISFAVTRDTVKITHRFVTPNREVEGAEILLTDGKPHPSSNGPGWVVVAKWLNPHLLEVVHTGSGTRTATVHQTYSVAQDRKTLTQRSV
jgi:hypothetical protein